MSHYVSPSRLDSDQKDLLISELKAENFELRNKERHYNQMYDNIGNIEHECAMVSEDKRAMEEGKFVIYLCVLILHSEMRRRSDADGIVIRRLRDENESLNRGNSSHSYYFYITNVLYSKPRP